jgi:hypothetical protein
MLVRHDVMYQEERNVGRKKSYLVLRHELLYRNLRRAKGNQSVRLVHGRSSKSVTPRLSIAGQKCYLCFRYRRLILSLRCKQRQEYQTILKYCLTMPESQKKQLFALQLLIDCVDY